MRKSDLDNITLAKSPESVDKLNGEFYGRFPYPWLPGKFDYLEDPAFETIMLNQELGCWDHRLVPENSKIWVAGCGTNQAIFTALKFPNATVTGSDISRKSLALCADNAKQLGISNLELREESINQTTYQQEFDYVICTGVIHHNADPSATLQKLATALKESGVLELMVYNRFHWILQAAFQQAIRMFDTAFGEIDFESELSLTRRLIDELTSDTLLGRYLSGFRNCEESKLADALLQPVSYTYTVESLEEMVGDSNLEILSPCISQFDKAKQRLSWNMEFKDLILKKAYDALPDVRRWQLSNLFMLETSPMLWFYLQRKNTGRQRMSERQICESFLEQRFAKVRTTQKSYILSSDRKYRLAFDSRPYPTAQPDDSVKKIIDLVDGKHSMKEIFNRLRVEPTFEFINRARIMLTTSAFPYLRAQ
jgi:SAM-dependent methyltransferase